MPKRDFFQVARDIVERASGRGQPEPVKKPSAVKGGTIRAAKLTARRRKQIAKKAAEKRWGR